MSKIQHADFDSHPCLMILSSDRVARPEAMVLADIKRIRQILAQTVHA